MKNIYSGFYKNPKRRLNLVDNPRIKIMVNIVNSLNLDNKNILDIGCYDGTFLSLIRNKNNDFYGIEASEYGIKEAIKKGVKMKNFYFNDIDKIPFKSDFFNLIIAGEIIEHIYDTDFFLKEIFRLLKKDGFLLISTPNIASLGRRIMLLFGLNPIIEISPNQQDSSGHIRYFTFRALEEILAKHGFKILTKKSDVVNFSFTGKLKSKLLAKLFPQIGQSIIYLAIKN
jgi:2-polyprenyl-3-methyl-5-hydroxy-6-metoxy-1,4-benzoquinol methylase